ncbi:MAG: putative collagen-binding domain-containing protein, partial [Armatimonadota bacterium]
SVDRVMRLAEELDVGFEMIMEAWAGEFPWNDRAAMTDELERLWLGYLIARYDAFNSVYLWTIMNEYEYYPDGKRDPKKRPETWAAATTRWMKSLAPHGHPFAVHTGPPMPPFAERFAFDLDAIDVIVYQLWGTTGESDAWLAAGIEEGIQASLAGWPGSAVFMEYGYERDPEVDCLPGSHRHLFVDHTRRGAWRGAMCGLGVGNGFDWTWGPVMIVDRDMPGVAQLALVKRFFTDVVRFETLRPAPELATACGDAAPGEKPLFMADEGYHQIVVYLPVGGTVSLDVVQDREYEASWFDPRTGDVMPATPSDGKFEAPATGAPHPDDWVLVVKCSGR